MNHIIDFLKIVFIEFSLAADNAIVVAAALAS